MGARQMMGKAAENCPLAKEVLAEVEAEESGSVPAKESSNVTAPDASAAPPCFNPMEMMAQMSANGANPMFEMMQRMMGQMGQNSDGTHPMKAMMKHKAKTCPMARQMMASMTEHCPLAKEVLAEIEAEEAAAFVPPEASAPAAPGQRGDPTLASFQKKQEIKEKKDAIREKKQEIRALKQEAKQCRQELKAMKQDKLKAKVVGHLDMDEHSKQVAGSSCLKTWKVKNTGNVVWPEGTFITFVKGHEKVIAAGYTVIPLPETVLPGEVTYIRSMLNVPTAVGGSFTVEYRLTDPVGKRFGQKLRTTFEVVAPPAPAAEEEAVPSPRESVNSLATAVEYEEELLEEVEEENQPPAYEQPAFEYPEELAMLMSMGFQDREMMESVLVATKGDVNAAVSMLF